MSEQKFWRTLAKSVLTATLHEHLVIVVALAVDLVSDLFLPGFDSLRHSS